MRFQSTPELKHLRVALKKLFPVQLHYRQLVEKSFISLWHADAVDSRHDWTALAH
jgi:hypothetical protein